jgi:hypothetical protein
MFRFSTFALVASGAGLGLEALLHNHPLAAARWLRYYWFRQADVAVPLAVALAGACLIISWMQRSEAWSSALAAAAVLLCAGHYAIIAVDRWQRPVPPAVAKMADPEAWLEACAWIRKHAPPDAVCLIPRHGQSFKWYAARADVVNWKDVPQDAAGVVEWRERLRDVYPTSETSAGPTVLNSPELWGARHALAMARRYRAQYVIARSEPPLGLPEAYAVSSPEGSGYAVYKTGVPSMSETPP